MNKFIRFLLFFLFTFQLSPAIGSDSLQAILIVGPQQDGTEQAIERMKDIAGVLKQNGIITHEFYGE